MPKSRIWSTEVIVVGFLLLFSYTYFHISNDWNANVRLDVARAIVEQGTVQIDAYADNTRDLAFYEGHVYSDKPPGVTLVILPLVAALHLVGKVLHWDPNAPSTVIWMLHLATLLCVGIPTMLTAIALYRVGSSLGQGAGAAAGAMIFALGTPAWPYAAVLYSHLFVAACLTGGFVAALRVREGTRDSVRKGARARTSAADARKTTWWALAQGLLGGLAIASEYHALPAVAILALFALAPIRRDESRRIARIAALLLAGAAPFAAAVLIYNNAAFGSPFRVGSTYNPYFPAMHTTGVFGFTYPKWDALTGILISSHRGLLRLAPVLVVAPIGAVLLIRRETTRAIGIVAASIVVCYVLVNASFTYWDGAGCFGPRYLYPALPFLCLLVAPVWALPSRALRIALALLAVVGVSISLMAISTNIHTSDIANRIGPAFRAGVIPVNTWERDHTPVPPSPNLPRTLADAWNFGTLAGLRGHASLLPLAAAWVLGAGMLFWRRARLRSR